MTLHTARAPENARTIFAKKTWGDHRVIDCARTAKDIGCDRGCFYVKDIFDKSLNSDDIFAYANNDVALVPEWRDAIVNAVLAYGCAYSHRVDVPKFEKIYGMQDLIQQRSYPGADLFAFTPAWWREHRDTFPDVVLGYEGWDFAAQWLMRESGFDRLPVLCYHEAHQAFWSRSENLQNHPVQKVCRERLTKWAKEAGAQGHIGAPHNFLFHGIVNQDDWDKRPTLTVFGLAKNCGTTIRRMLDSISIATAGFKSVRYAVLANSTTSRPLLGTSARVRDRTLDELQLWTNYDPRNRVAQEFPGDLHSDSEIGRFRKMSMLRNFLRSMAPLSDWNLMTDLDAQQLVDVGGITSLMRQNIWDVVATYGIRSWDEVKHWRRAEEKFMWREKEWVYYDLLAFEDEERRRMLWHWPSKPPEVWYPHGVDIDATFTSSNIIPSMTEGWTAVNSAFGPATFYRKSTLAGLHYDLKTNQVEHQTLHAAMRARGAKIALASNIVGIYS